MTETAPPQSWRTAARDGVTDLLPVTLGAIPFGLLAGIAALEADLPAWMASVFSVGVFAGASQLAALELLADDASAVVVIGTILVINARMLMYSASLAPAMADEPRGRRAVMAYFMTDQTYALTISKLDREPAHPHRFAYYLSGGLLLWVSWQVFTIVGALAGRVIPPDIPIEFAVPMVFAALLVPAVKDRPTLAAALTSAVVATLGRPLPSNLGLLLAALGGIAVGVVVSERTADDTAVAA